MAQPTLLCIPDISGFTQFMSEVDFELSSRVIPSLLNKVIYANFIGLKVSEIEGDAVLFYKTGELPSFDDLVAQCAKFYSEFYNQMLILQKVYSENDQAFEIPEILGLKIILHFGDEVASAQVGKSIKLMGEDVIIAHRLLKNDIELDEYLLISAKLMSLYEGKEERKVSWGKLMEGEADYEHIGKLRYWYVDLSPLVGQ